ncbi:cation diffusion facilitator family transporter [Brachyspira aalborgi]|uniref:Cation transporter n=1 Tax=Brachyspira aalborgi TaxID=29522 RepID=A0A5C8CHD9_9SPIR|nr:cation diffusion facilitator family transporter [Brachyspira aalborgi]TXJ12854.1 cation transporter [Brachyspira aalborgi]
MNKNEIKSKYMIIEGIVSVIVNILLFAFKYAVGIFSGSLSIIADAWHSLSDCISSIIVIIGGIFSKKPADKEHPFGHGRIELITSFIVGIMLIFIGYTFFAEAIKNLLNKQTATFNKISIIAMIVSIIIKEILAQYSFWAYRKSGAKSLYADAWHHRSDSITSIIILVGILIGKNFWQLDGILSIIVSIVIFIAAFDVIKSSIKPLIGEYPSEEIINKIKNIAKELNLNSESLHHFHIHIYGSHTEITFHIRFPKDMTVFEAHNMSTLLENEIREKLFIEATIHIEAY